MKKQINKDIDTLSLSTNHIVYEKELENIKKKYKENGCYLLFKKEFKRRGDKSRKKLSKADPTRLEMISWIIKSMMGDLNTNFKCTVIEETGGMDLFTDEFVLVGKIHDDFNNFCQNMFVSYLMIDALVKIERRVNYRKIEQKGFYDYFKSMRALENAFVKPFSSLFGTISARDKNHILDMKVLSVLLEIYIEEMTWQSLNEGLCDEKNAKKLNRSLKLTRTYAKRYTESLIDEVLSAGGPYDEIESKITETKISE